MTPPRALIAFTLGFAVWMLSIAAAFWVNYKEKRGGRSNRGS